MGTECPQEPPPGGRAPIDNGQRVSPILLFIYPSSRRTAGVGRGRPVSCTGLGVSPAPLFLYPPLPIAAGYRVCNPIAGSGVSPKPPFYSPLPTAAGVQGAAAPWRGPGCPRFFLFIYPLSPEGRGGRGSGVYPLPSTPHHNVQNSTPNSPKTWRVLPAKGDCIYRRRKTSYVFVYF